MKKKIFKVRTGGLFHGITYIVCAYNKKEVIDIMKEQEDEIISKNEIEKIELKKSGIVASGEFHWMYHK